MSENKFKVSITIFAQKTNGSAGVNEFVTREFKISDSYTSEELEEMVANLAPAYSPENKEI